jgi:hypothetical protein
VRVTERVFGRERCGNGYSHTRTIWLAPARHALLRIPRYRNSCWSRVLENTLAAAKVVNRATWSCLAGARRPRPALRPLCGGEARPMLQRAEYGRGDCENARSPAPVQCRHAASIVIRARAAKILFPEATRGPRPSSAAPLSQAGTAALAPHVRLLVLARHYAEGRVWPQQVCQTPHETSCSAFSVHTRRPARRCGGYAARRHVPYHAALKTDAAAPTLRAALRLRYADAPQLSFCKVTQPKSYSQRRRAALWCVATAPPAQCVSATALDDRLLVSAAVNNGTRRRA